MLILTVSFTKTAALLKLPNNPSRVCAVIIRGEIITQRETRTDAVARKCTHRKQVATEFIAGEGGGCNVVSALGSAVCGFGTSDGTRRTTHYQSYPRKLSRGRIVSRSICAQPHCSRRARPRSSTMNVHVRMLRGGAAMRARVPRGKYL